MALGDSEERFPPLFTQIHSKDERRVRVVKAGLSSSGKKILGLKLSNPWAIKILEGLGSISEHVGLYQQSK